MNKKLIVKKLDSGKIIYCVLSDQVPLEKQLNDVFMIKSGSSYGFYVDFSENFIAIKDIITQEAVGRFEVLSLLDTDEDVVLTWQDCV